MSSLAYRPYLSDRQSGAWPLLSRLNNPHLFLVAEIFLFNMSAAVTKANSNEFDLSLLQLYNQQVLADPYPLYHRLQAQDPVHWDPFLHAWVITRYQDVVKVLQDCSAKCAPSPERLASMGATAMLPIGEVLHRQMLFLDPPDHTKLRTLCTVAFTPQKVAAL